MPKRDRGADQFLKIAGYDGANQIFETVTPFRGRSEAAITSLLQRLACRGPDEDKIIAASLPRNARGYQPLLEPLRDIGPGRRQTISVGQGIFYVASFWRRDELPEDRVR